MWTNKPQRRTFIERVGIGICMAVLYVVAAALLTSYAGKDVPEAVFWGGFGLCVFAGYIFS